MTVLIRLTSAGISTGPFNLYSNIDNFSSFFETQVSRNNLMSGYTSILVPTGTTTIQVRSTGVCTNSVNIPVTGITTSTSTTTSSTTSTTSTTTIDPCGTLAGTAVAI